MQGPHYQTSLSNKSVASAKTQATKNEPKTQRRASATYTKAKPVSLTQMTSARSSLMKDQKPFTTEKKRQPIKHSSINLPLRQSAEALPLDNSVEEMLTRLIVGDEKLRELLVQTT